MRVVRRRVRWRVCMVGWFSRVVVVRGCGQGLWRGDRAGVMRWTVGIERVGRWSSLGRKRGDVLVYSLLLTISRVRDR